MYCNELHEDSRFSALQTTEKKQCILYIEILYDKETITLFKSKYQVINIHL